MMSDQDDGEGGPRRTWRLPRAAVDFRAPDDAATFASNLVRADMDRLSRRDWTEVAKAAEVRVVVDAILSGTDPAVGEVALAMAAFAASLPDVVDVRDRTTKRRNNRTATIVQASTRYWLLDVTLSHGARRVVVKAEATGMGWTRHAMARRHERGARPGMHGLPIATGLARERTTLRLACRAARRIGVEDVHVPVDGGILKGSITLDPGFAPPASGCMSFGTGGSKVNSVPPIGLAEDGTWWFGVTYLAGDQLHMSDFRHLNAWNAISAAPEVAALDPLWSWTNGDDARRLVAEAEAAVGGDLEVLLASRSDDPDVVGREEPVQGDGGVAPSSIPSPDRIPR